MTLISGIDSLPDLLADMHRPVSECRIEKVAEKRLNVYDATMDIKYFLRLMGTLLIFAACIHFIDLHEIWILLRQIDLSFYLLSLLFIASGSIFIQLFIKKKIFSHYHIDVSPFELIRIEFSLTYFNLVLPRAAIMGMRWRKYAGFCSAKKGGVIILVENTIQVTGIALTGLIFLLVEMKNVDNPLYFIPMILIITTALTIFFVVRHSPWRTAIEEMKNRMILKLMVVSLVGNLIFISALYLLTKAFSFNLAFTAIAWVRSLAVLIQLLPVTIAGLGLREGSYMVLLGLYGIRQEEAFAYSMGLFSQIIVLSGIGLLIELTDALAMRKKRQ